MPHYQRVVSVVDRRQAFTHPEDDSDGVGEYDHPRYGSGPRGYRSDDQRGYRGGLGTEWRNCPPFRREESFSYYRGHNKEQPVGRQVEIRTVGRVASQRSVRGQRLPLHRSLSTAQPKDGDDTVMQALMNLDRGDERGGPRRKAPYAPIRERSPVKRDVPPSSRGRAGSSGSSRSYSPDRNKSHPYSGQPRKNKERPPSYVASGHRDGSPHSTISATKQEETVGGSGELEDISGNTRDECTKPTDDLQDHRSQVIAAKAMEIEKLYRQDCETFGTVVKMLVAKEPSLEKQLQAPLKESLTEIRERCLEDLRHFISKLDEAQEC